jgi:GNAT superfamily N-acetyltransferase
MTADVPMDDSLSVLPGTSAGVSPDGRLGTPPGEPLWRLLQLEELPAIEGLHRLSIGTAGPDVVKPENRDFFAGLLAGRGRMLGLYDGAELIAYGVLQTDLLANDDPRAALGIGRHLAIAKLAGAAVAPGHRGRGLQRASIRARIALAGDTPLLFSTAAPANTASLQNLLAEGFAVRARVTRYGGLQRYLMVREHAPATLSADRVTVEIADTARQDDLLATGWRAIAANDAGDALVFAGAAR